MSHLSNEKDQILRLFRDRLQHFSETEFGSPEREIPNKGKRRHSKAQQSLYIGYIPLQGVTKTDE